MSLETITIFLKDTILGIVILGAIGSILAVLMLRLINFTFKKFLPKQIVQIYKIRELQNYSHGFAVGILLYGKNPVRLIGYFAYHLARLAILLVICATSFLIFGILIVNKGQTQSLLSYGTYFSIFISLFSGYFVRQEFKIIRLFYNHDVVPLLAEGKKQHEK